MTREAPQVGLEPTTLCIKRVVKSLQVAALQQLTRAFRIAQAPEKCENARSHRNATATAARNFIRTALARAGTTSEWGQPMTLEQRLDAARWSL